MSVPVRKFTWQKTWRVIPTRYPRTDLLDRVSSPEDRRGAEEVDGRTNRRMRFLRNEFSSLRPNDRLSKQTHRHLMSPFTKPRGGRFSDETMGCCYAADSLQTAVAEKMYHHRIFLADTDLPPMRLDMTALIFKLSGEMVDLRGLRHEQPELYDPRSYSQSRPFGRRLWEQDRGGIIYDSVRRAGGLCAAVFKPQCLSHVREDRCLLFFWDGKTITPYELQEYPYL